MTDPSQQQQQRGLYTQSTLVLQPVGSRGDIRLDSYSPEDPSRNGPRVSVPALSQPFLPQPQFTPAHSSAVSSYTLRTQTTAASFRDSEAPATESQAAASQLDEFLEDDEESREIARKLKESQRRQQEILKRLAEKSSSRRDSAAGMEKTPNADVYARTAIDPLPVSAQQTENTSRLFTSPLPTANTSLNTFLASPHAAAAPVTPSLNGSAYWPRAPTQVTPPPAAISVRNATVPEPSSFMMQHILSQSQQKDTLIADLRASVGDHIGTANDESVNLKAQMDIVERQQRLREDDLTDRIQDLSMKLSTAMAAENNLRGDVKSLQLEKMELIRAHAIKVGELEARIAGLQSETERRELGQRKVELELATAKKEIDQLQDEAKIAASEHAQAIEALEAKVAQLSRERTATSDQVRSLSEGDATAQREIKALKDNIEMKELELSLLQKSKDTQAQLLDSVKAQVSGLQEQIAELKTVAAQVPQLKREVEQRQKIEAEKEGLQAQLAAAQAAHEAEVSEKNQLQAEIAGLQQQRQEFHRQLLLAEQRFQELVGPESELEQTKQQIGYLNSQVDKFKSHVRDLQMDLDQGKERRLLLESKLQSVQNEITADLAVIQRMVELAVAGDYRSLTEGKEGSAPSLTTQSAAVRSAVSSLRLTATSALKELSTLRAVKTSADQQVEKLLTDIAASRNELMESKRANIELQALISGQQQDIKALQNAISDAQQQLSQLRAKAATMDSELAERNKLIRGCVHELADIASIARSGQASSIADVPEDNNAFAFLRTRLIDALEVVKQQLRLRAAEFSHLQSELATSQDRTQQLQQLFRQAQAAEQQKFEELSEAHNSDIDRIRHEMDQQKAELEGNLAKTTAEATSQLEALAGERDATLAALEQLKSTLEESHVTALQLQNELKKSGSQVSAYRSACNLLFRGYSTLETRCAELSSQKLYLAARNRKLEKVQADVQSLMQAMTGDSALPSSPGPSLQAALPRKPYGRVFKVGAIAVLSLNRLLRFRRERPVYGVVSKVRGEVVALGSPTRLPDDLPELDCATESRSLDSFSRLLFHLRSVGRQFVPQLPRVASLRSPGKAPLITVLAPPSLRRPQPDREDRTNWDGDNDNNYSIQVAVIRKVALALSTRIRDLERDNKSLQQRAHDLNTKLTNAIGLNDSLASAHASSSDLGNRLQGRVEELQRQLTRTVPEEKFEQLRSQHQQLLEQVTALEAEKRRTQDSLEAVKRQLQMAEASLSSKARAIAALQTATAERNEEMQTVSGYLRHKSEEMAAMEKERKQLQSQCTETQKNLELCLASNLELTARLRSLDSELTSNKELVRQLQTALSQLGSLRVDPSSVPNITLTAQPSDPSTPSGVFRASSTPPRPSSPTLFSTLRPSSPTAGSLARMTPQLNSSVPGVAPRQLSFNVASPSSSRANVSFMQPTPGAPVPKLPTVDTSLNRSVAQPQLQNVSSASGTVDASAVSNMLGGVHISHSKGKLQVAIDRSRWGIAKADGFEQESAVDVVQSVPVGRIEVYSPRRGNAASPSSGTGQAGFFPQSQAAAGPSVSRSVRSQDSKRSLNQELTDAMIRSFDSSSH